MGQDHLFFLIKNTRTRREWNDLIVVVSLLLWISPPTAYWQAGLVVENTRWGVEVPLWFLTPEKLLISLGFGVLICRMGMTKIQMEWETKDPVTPQILKALLIAFLVQRHWEAEADTAQSSPLPQHFLFWCLDPLPSHLVAHPDYAPCLSHEILRLREEMFAMASGKFTDPGAQCHSVWSKWVSKLHFWSSHSPG